VIGSIEQVAARLFGPDAPHGVSLALVVRHNGETVYERYGIQPDTIFGPGGPVTADTPLISWSVAKSITHAVVGVLVGEGRLDVGAPAPVPAWQNTPKAAITVQQLLEMRSGLEFVEEYEEGHASHCLEMLFGAGRDDMAGYAAGLPLLHPPGTVWNYSSGTTNIVARIAGDVIGGGEDGMRTFLAERLFGPLGMHSAEPRFDTAGTFTGSSYVYATATDFARFGELYLADGVVGGRRLLPLGWVDHGRTFVSRDPEGVCDYGRHWWLWRDRLVFAAHGYEGQYVLVDPRSATVVVHLGKSPAEIRPPLIGALTELLDAF
jgi:CubicO group peptidase (beta-lactamase class C family)